jgi:mannose-6-phosphate isomerase-like protein (cupin superfamily)
MEDGTATTRLQDDAENRFVRLRAELGVTSFGLNQIVLHPGQRGRIHAHERQEEVYLVPDGTLTLVVEGEESTYGRGELIRVAPGVRRQLVNRGPGTLHLLAIGGAGEHEGRDGKAWTAWDATESARPQETPMPDDLPASELRRA